MRAPTIGSATRGIEDLKHTGGIADDALKSSSAQTYADNMQGTGAAKGLLGGGQAFTSGLGGQPSPMSQAIERKSTAKFNDGQGAIKAKVKADSADQYFTKLATVKELVGQEQEMNYQKALAKYKADQARKAARAGIVGEVLGIVVGVVAGIYTGGTGAAAGYQGGKMAGQAIAGGG